MWIQLPNTSRDNRALETTFNELREKEEGALVAYLTGGDPYTEAFQANCAALIEGGADILEVGIPFSDPIADGPVIQASSMRALSKGTTPAGILATIRELASHIRVPVVALTYYNPILAMGPDRFLERAHDAGVNGVVIPDLPMEEGRDFGNLAAKHCVDSVLLAAPNTSKPRLQKIVEGSRGFLYLVSLYGVTGPRDELSSQALATVKRVKKLAAGKIPISAGFGISRPEQVSSLLSTGADGVIVGSTLVNIVAQHLDQPSEAADHLRKTVATLKQATRRTA